LGNVKELKIGKELTTGLTAQSKKEVGEVTNVKNGKTASDTD